MHIFQMFLIAVSLAMDAFSVSVSSCMHVKKVPVWVSIKFGIFFGGFQFVMPILGALTANTFLTYFIKISNLISLILLSIIGGKMIYESLKVVDSKDNENFIKNAKTSAIIVLAIATSIDAFAVGVTFGLSNENTYLAAAIIGLVAFILSALGAQFGSVLSFIKPKIAERIGGAVLIAIGVKIFIGL